MRVTAMQEYGLRCMLQLTAHNSDQPLAVREIAKRERLTPVYVEKILVHLRRGGLVNSVRGVNGGYVLAKPAAGISVAAVLAALGQVHLGADLCKKYTGTASVCVHQDNCGIRPIWGTLTRYIFGFLEKITLDQLLKDEALVSSSVDRAAAKSPLLAILKAGS